MNGLLAIYKKQDTSFASLKEKLSKGLKTLSHRGNKLCTPFILDKNFQPVDPGRMADHGMAADFDGVTRSDATATTNEAGGRMIMGSCSFQSNESHIASHNGNILFFEGHLFNRNELCEQLSIASGDNTTDSEIVLHMFEKSGTNCFSSLKGFWSLIYFDSVNKSIYGARDHFGNRPMYFCNTGNQFALASESRTLYSLFEDARSINKDTVTDFLLWGNIGRLDQYFFNDIHTLMPSHFVKYEMESDILTIERYYAIHYNQSNVAYSAINEKLYINKLYDLISNSVQDNINLYDGAIAVGVSGGMDSSALICTAKKTNPNRTLVAYTATDNYDGGEAQWAEKIVRHTNAEWVKVVCTPEYIIEMLDTINRVHNIPLYNPSSIAQYKAIEEVKKHGQSVFIDGQGGDELLGGYPEYFPLFLKSLRKNGEWKNWKNELSQTGNSGITKKEIITRRLKLWAKTHYYTPQVLAQKKRKHEYESLTPQVRDNYFKQPSPIQNIDKKILNDALFESYTIFLSNILRWGEHSAASHSIECIMPLADSLDLAEFAFSVPSSFKIHNGWNKYLLRKAMAGTVPDEICWRKQKMGFYTPEQNWLNEIGKVMFDTIEKLEDPEDCINKKYILENRHALYTSSNLLYQRFIFRCYSYLLWRNGLPE